MEMLLRPSSLFRLRRNKFSLIRVTCAIGSIVAVFLLLFRTINTNNHTNSGSNSLLPESQRLSDGDHLNNDQNNHNSINSNNLNSNNNEAVYHHQHSSVIKELSAKQLQEFKKLMPVVAGWGENGKAVTLTDKEEIKLSDEQFRLGAFNVY